MNYLLHRVLIFSFFFLFYQGLNAQNTFQKTFGSTGNEEGIWVANTSTGYIVSGYTTSTTTGRDGYLLNLDFDGNVIWQKKVVGGNLDDVFNTVFETDGGFLVLGEVTKTTNSKDMWLLKVDQNGEVLWSKTIGDAGYNELGYCLIPVSGNRILLSGAKAVNNTNGFNSCFYLLSDDGDLIWGKYFEGGSVGNLMRASYVDNGVIYASGGSEADAVFMRLELETGNIISGTSYPRDYNDAMYYQQPAPDGNIVIADATWSADDGNTQRQWVNKITREGQTIWSKVYWRASSHLRGRIEIAGDGNFLLTSYDGAFSNNGDAMLIKIDGQGNILWSRNYGQPGLDWLWKSQMTPDGGFISVGAATNNGNRDLLVIKTDADGGIAGCCVPSANIIVQDFPHDSPDFDFSSQTWRVPVVVSSQSADVTLQPEARCTQLQPELFNDISLCPNEVFILNGIGYNAPNELVDTLPNASGCDTIVHYTLSLSPQSSGSESITFCAGENVLIGGTSYTESGVVLDTLTAANGCDSIVTYTLTQLPQISTDETITFCAGDSVLIAGTSYTESGVVLDTLTAANGCDSIVTYTLTQLPQISTAETITFCAGDSVTIGGQVYTEAGEVTETFSGVNGCDSTITYTLTILPQFAGTETITFCFGDSVSINGQVYTEAGEVVEIYTAASGCDSVITYTLTQLPQAGGAETITFCVGDSVLIDGQYYTESGTVTDTLTAVNGCDSIVTYTLELLPQPTINETITLCPGESVVLNGQTYTQPGIVTFTLPAASGCDTLATYTLVSALPAPSVVTINCPTNISIIAEPGTAPVVVDYNLPTSASNCPCPGIALNRTAGLASGAAFPNGITQVCYTAKDSCGNSASCCFTVTIREEQPCDVKVNGCIRYELLTITADADANRTYRIRVINNCANKLIYTAIQLPNGVTAMEPANLSTFTSEGGINYEVRNPNFSPFYSIRFKTTNDSISGGESDIFEYTLPAQAVPLFINITSRLAPQVFYEAHLNTFACPIGITPNKGSSDDRSVKASQHMSVFPNPTEGTLWVDLGDWTGKGIDYRIFNTQGQQVMMNIKVATDGLLNIALPETMPNGLFFLEVFGPDGSKQTARFMLQR